MRYIIDRFEGKFAVLEAENCEFTDIERARLPRDVAEGDVLLHEAGLWRVDTQETAARRASTRAKLESLWADK